MITRYTGREKDVDVPAQIDGAWVTEIDSHAFSQNLIMKSIVLPEHVTRIGESAFRGCQSLTQVSLPASLTEIRAGAFYGCSKLTDVDLPDSLVTIGYGAFSDCVALADISIPVSTTEIGGYAFDKTPWLNDQIQNDPDKPIVVGNGILLYCPGDQIPTNVRSLSSHLFANRNDLEAIVIPDSVEALGDYAFYNCKALTEITLPGSVKRIEEHCFDGCSNLETVNIPDSVEYIGASAFANTMWLLLYPDDFVVVGDGVLIAYYGGNADKVVVPDGVKSIGSESFEGKVIGEIVLPDTLKRIEDSAFHYCNIERLFIPDSVEYVGKEIVGDGVGIKYLKLPSTMRSIDHDFSATPSSTLLMYVPDSVKYIAPDWGDPDYYAILCHKGSYAEKYAKNNNKKYITIADNISDCNIRLDKSAFEYTGEEIKPTITVTGIDYDAPSFNDITMPTFPNKATLTEGVDYKAEYNNNIESGEATVVISGLGFYKGSKTLTYTILKDINRCSVSISPTSFTYDGRQKLPIASVTDGGKTLVENTDYTVKYKNNIKAGEAEITVIGKGDYCKETALNFTIEKADISALKAELSRKEFTYSGREIKPTVMMSNDGVVFLENRDYSVEYSDNVTVGKGSIYITGIDSCFGEQNFEFTIKPRSVEECSFSFDNDAWIYDGTEKTPKITARYGQAELKEGVDYTVSYSSNIEPGEGTAIVTGKGNFTGEKELSFGITKDISTMRTELEYISTVYDGSQKQPLVKVYDGDTEISSFNVSYSENVNAGEAKAIVSGTGNYSGSITKAFTIERADISNYSIELSTNTYTYDGSEKTPSTAVYDNRRFQVASVKFSYSDNVNAGTATVTAVGTGNYTGSLSANYTITPQDLTNRKYSLSQTSYAFDGSEKCPEFVVDDEALAKDRDYTVTYENNINAGTPMAVLSGIGNYTGEVKLGFTITPKFLSALPASLSMTEYKYDGTLKQPEITITDGDIPLIFGRDYVVNYSDNRSPGTASAVITGTGNYTGAQTKYFNIRKVNEDDDGDRIDISGYAVTLSKLSYVYDGTEKFPSVTVKNGMVFLMQDADYTVSYVNNRNVGTAQAIVRGIGIYKGEKTVSYYINSADKTDISTCSITLSKNRYNYDGSAKKPSVTVKNGFDTLTYAADYTVEYRDNTNVGTASAVITGIGNYGGTKTVTFTISRAAAADISTCAVIFARGEFVYDGTPKTPEVTVKLKGAVLEKDKDYTVAYEDNIAPGKAKVIITGIGSYSGKREATYPIKASQYVKNTFKWGSDNWNFKNSSYSGDFSADTYRSQIG